MYRKLGKFTAIPLLLSRRKSRHHVAVKCTNVYRSIYQGHRNYHTKSLHHWNEVAHNLNLDHSVKISFYTWFLWCVHMGPECSYNNCSNANSFPIIKRLKCIILFLLAFYYMEKNNLKITLRPRIKMQMTK